MVLVKVAQVLKAKGWTAYRLAEEAGISRTVAYKLARGDVQRFDLETLDAVCQVLGCQPGDLLEYVAKRKR